MAYSVADLEFAERDLFKKDKPILSSCNLLTDSVISSGWYTETGRNSRAFNVDNLPPSLAYDGFAHLQSVSGASEQQLFFSINTTPISFDVLAILNHNAQSVVVRIADDAGMARNRRTVVSFQGSPRNVAFMNERYKNVQYIEVEFKLQGGNKTFAQVGEIFIGKRHQLPALPNEPYEPYGLFNAFIDRESQIGVSKRYVRYMGQKRLQPQWEIISAQDISIITTWWRSCSFGTRNFLYCETPKSQPEKTWLMSERSGSLLLPKNNGPYSHTLGLNFSEQPPFNTDVTNQ